MVKLSQFLVFGAFFAISVRAQYEDDAPAPAAQYSVDTPADAAGGSDAPNAGTGSDAQPVVQAHVVTPSGAAAAAVPQASSSLSASLNFEKSIWIWTPGETGGRHPPVGRRYFLKSWASPAGKVPVTADIIWSAADTATLYVNGQEISSTAYDWRNGGRFCLKLDPCRNVFAIAAETKQRAIPGVIAAILVTYKDGSTSTIVTDTTWESHREAPADFYKLSYDPTTPYKNQTWQGAENFGKYQEYATVKIQDAAAVTTFDNANFIWGNELDAQNRTQDGVVRQFRRVIPLPAGVTTSSVEILITVDDMYTLYVNGLHVGGASAWNQAQLYKVDNVKGPRIVVAVHAENVGHSVAHLLASIKVVSALADAPSCRSTFPVKTDEKWKVNWSFEHKDYRDDLPWPGAKIIRPYTPGTYTIPTTPSPKGSLLPGAPKGSKA